MIQENKELLLKDLCARLPYGVKILHEGWSYEWDDELSTVERVVGIDDEFIYTKVIDNHNGEEYRDDKHPIDIFDDKLFLRPLSSMTEEESETWRLICSMSGYDMNEVDANAAVDWLNANYFDYRGMIPRGLALPAPEGMYNE